MKVGKTSKKEIDTLYTLLNELEWLDKELQRVEFDDVDWEGFDVLSKLGSVKSRGLDLERERTAEFFLEDLVRELSAIHFQRILTNTQVLLDNCADPNLDHVDFNQDIKKGLELLHRWASDEPGRRREFQVEKVAHAELERVGDSQHTSQCPNCEPGTLVMVRDPETQLLMHYDSCLYCGQHYHYTDVVNGVIVIDNEVTH